jgi:O-antigen ligase
VRTFAHHPVAGVGAGGFAVEWLRERDIAETVRDAHSLYIETAAELGLVGLAALALLVAGGIRTTAVALRRGETAAAAAALATWALHAALDWDWEMPALTLVAVVLLARLAVEAEPRAAAATVSARSGTAAAAPPRAPHPAT